MKDLDVVEIPMQFAEETMPRHPYFEEHHMMCRNRNRNELSIRMMWESGLVVQSGKTLLIYQIYRLPNNEYTFNLHPTYLKGK